MARKSGWQEFAENFKSSYKMVNDVKQQYATNQIMKDKIEEGESGKYTYMGKEYGTENEALSQQYSRLADNATRFGDTDKGLGYRKQITDIESNRIQADIARATKQDQINLQGQLAVLMAQANIGNKNADTARLGSVTGLNNQSLAEKKATFDTRLRSLVANAGLDESNATIAEVKAAIAKGTQSEEQAALLAEINQRKTVAEVDGANFKTVADLNIDKLEADIADTEAGTKVKTATEGQIGAETKRTEALTAKQVFENARQEAFKIEDYAAYGESLNADLEAAKARGDESSLAALTAQRGELREMALMDFHTFVPESDEATYGTADEQRYDQWLGMIKTFDGPEAALKWQNSHNAETTGLILADSNRLKAEVDSAFQPGGGGLNRVADMMDGINGDGTGVKVIRDSDGVKLVETNADGSMYRVVAAGKTETEVQKIVQTMAGPEGAIKVADVLHQTKTRKLDIEKAEQEIETAKVGQALKAAQGRLATAQVKSVDFNNKLTEQQTKQISEKITDIITDRQGISRKDKQTLVIKELAKFLTFNLDASDDEISAFVSQLGGASDQVSDEFAEFENVTE
jgi:uncharacterized protein YbcV (DUF1398 family)